MRFEVPQFIDVEDKIFGPLTFKQFIYLVGGAALAYVAYKFLPFPFWLPVSLVCVALGLALAFYKLNNWPFIEVIQSYLNYLIKGKIYIWKRAPADKKKAGKKTPPAAAAPSAAKVFNEKTMSDLAQNLDILDSYRQ